jgi:hypothetical protein
MRPSYKRPYYYIHNVNSNNSGSLPTNPYNPNKIIQLYTGGDSAIRLLFIEAREKNVILYKDKLYYYADAVLGATDDAAILFLKDPKNANLLKLIKQDTYPELMKNTKVNSDK